MWSFGSIGIATPLALLALAALPIIWLVIRALPPVPKSQIFPPTSLLSGIAPTQETPQKAPQWLAWFRLFTLSCLIVGFSGPVVNPTKIQDSRPLLLVIDNGWTSAPLWRAMIEEAAILARASTTQVRLMFTVSGSQGSQAIETLSPSQAASRLRAAMPMPVLPDHQRVAQATATLKPGQRIFWFSDGLEHSGTANLADSLKRLGTVKVRAAPNPVIAITRAKPSPEGFQLGFATAPAAPYQLKIEAINHIGQSLGAVTLARAAWGGTFSLEPVIARGVVALRSGDVRSAGGVFLLDAFDRRVRTGLVMPRAVDQPLLSDTHYVKEALAPYSSLSLGDLHQLSGAGLDALILTDVGQLPDHEAKALEQFVERGGLLLRFAGPRLLASQQGALIPAPLAAEPRVLSGSLASETAGQIAAFEPTSPFAGLTIPQDTRINQVALIAPQAESEDTDGRALARKPSPVQVWARLVDGTPLVSARAIGRGTLVLFHTTAGPAWSDVAFSGLQISMLRRVLARAASSAIPAQFVAGTVPLKPVLVLDGFGAFITPDASIRPLQPTILKDLKPSVDQPPGIYEGGGARWILQAARPDLQLLALKPVGGIERLRAAEQQPRALASAFLIVGMMLMILDLVIAVLLGHRQEAHRLFSWMKRFSVKKNTPILRHTLLIWGLYSLIVTLPAPASAQEPNRAQLSQDVVLAYVQSGDAALDSATRRGLEGLARALRERTSVEPGPVKAIDPVKDDLALYPIVFWTLGERAMEPKPEMARALDLFMKNGGVLFVDSRGAGRTPAMATALVRAALRGIEAPPLEPVPLGHVLTKSFYILQRFPGRYPNAQIWVETVASAQASANDGVSSLILGDGDWAYAWAKAPRAPTLGDLDVEPTPSEWSIRVGINVVLYALTGNYKADQIHMPALLERFGRRNSTTDMPDARQSRRP
ncbi:DUF4159 domain-containing protein [Candidatus Phycosocius spiralis]|uniref:LytTR family transcriptional regulator n=1 Tax=Candidatus Phycosocius spiralis TaxID=2815099 RepID=A0ABQ4PV78_9PROT|nr:DUF4159 domain-containing protein [Candidatus Phycosocius spiralis]GIU66893.1 LytTR family transcriptional regulator [Candidatus Phycosocius spiralis]